MALRHPDAARSDPFTLYRLWKADLDRYSSPSTAQLYRRTAFACAADLERHPLDWTSGELRRYLDQLTPASAKNARQALSSWLDWMVARGFRESNPLDAVQPRRRRRQRIKRALTEEELTRLVISAAWGPRYRSRWVESRRRIALLMLAQYHTGLRPGEITTLLVSEVHLDDERPRIEVTGTKTDNDREVPLSAKAQEVFAELVEGRVGRVSNVNSNSYWDHYNRAAVRAEIPPERRRPYALRHTFATRLIDAGVHPRRIAELMGHSDLRTIMTYTAQEYEELRAAVELLP